MQDLFKQTATGMAAGATTAIARGGKFDIVRVATDAFGNALGNSLAGMTTQSGGTQDTPGTSKPISQEQAERNMYGGMTSRQVLGGDKDWLSALGAYDGPYGTGGNDERIPNYQAPIRQVVVDGGDVNQRLNAIFGLTPKSIGSAQASNDIVAQQMSDLGAGIWDGIKAIPSGIWNGVVTVADGYRGLAYLATGNINSFRPRSNVTLDGIARGIVDNSPVGVLGAMFDNNYRAAGSRFVGTVAGLGGSYASPYLTKIPGMSYDVGATAKWLAPKAGELLENYMYRSGSLTYAVPPVTRLGSGGANALLPEYVAGFSESDVLAVSKGSRPDPATYLTQSYQDAHAALFQDGAVRIQPTAPTGTIGRTETWVFPKSLADDAIAGSGGNVRALEKLLGLSSHAKFIVNLLPKPLIKD
ncbi:hypothetical protein ACL58G_24905 [Massilia sp. GER05]|uniref:hypothetical protein n=1 Tax=Massilia sp. GER05 TaxID=3394605 RepID=UPI003F87FC0B